MSRKGQFYIITAVLLIALAFGTVFSAKKIIKSERAFEELRKNYVKESAFAANQDEFEDFTRKFMDYARTKDKNFKLIAVHTTSEEIQVYNAYGKTININNELSLQDNEAGAVSKTSEVGILTDDDIYYFDATEGTIKAIFMSEGKTAKRVYVHE